MSLKIQVLGEDGKLHLLAREEIKTIEYGKKSLMPADYDKKLSAAEFEGLLEFLSRQGETGRSR